MKIERHETGPRMSKAVIHGDTVYFRKPKRAPRSRMTARKPAHNRRSAEYAVQNVGAFGAGIFVLGLICALFGIGRNAFRYAGITLAIVMLIARAEPAWMIAIHRFLEISVGIAVGLLLTAVWPEPEPAAA